MKDQDIISGIRQGKAQASLESIYRQFPVVRRMIVSNSGSEEEAKDIFQESIIIFYRMCQKPGFQLSSSISTLIYAISKKLWLKKLRDYHSKVLELKEPEFLQSEEAQVQEEEDHLAKVKVMESVLSDLGEPCRKLLVKFYFEKISMKEIALDMGYSGEKTAKAQKYKCLERAKKMAKSIHSTLQSIHK